MKDPLKGSGGLWDMIRGGGRTSKMASMLGAPSAQQIAFVRSLAKGKRRPETLHVPLVRLRTSIFDLETTGFHYHYGDEILSVGAVHAEGEVISDQEYYSLAKPTCTVPERICELTGITQEMAENAKPLIEVLREFMSFVDDRVLIAHGSAHDKAFLDVALWKTSKAHLEHRVLDTMMIARKLEPNREVSRLDDWLNIYQIPITKRHHALEDARMTARLWTALVSRLKERGVSTLGDLYAYLSK